MIKNVKIEKNKKINKEKIGLKNHGQAGSFITTTTTFYHPVA